MPRVQQSEYLVNNRGRLIGVLDGPPGTLTTREGDKMSVLRVKVEERVFDRTGKLRNQNRKFTVAFFQPLADWVLANARPEQNIKVALRFDMYAPDRHRAELRLIGEGLELEADGEKKQAKLDVSADKPTLVEEAPDY
ncbi:MAG TPA: hypothetical protein VGG33_29215 [Polyangia bacterium]